MNSQKYAKLAKCPSYDFLGLHEVKKVPMNLNYSPRESNILEMNENSRFHSSPTTTELDLLSTLNHIQDPTKSDHRKYLFLWMSTCYIVHAKYRKTHPFYSVSEYWVSIIVSIKFK